MVWPVPPPPPLSVSVVELPLQMVEELAVAEVGSADFWFTVTVTEAQVVLKLQGAPSSYRPKYVVVVVGLTLKLPVPTKVPPHEEVYQAIVCVVPPPPPFSVRVDDCPLQIVEGLALAEVGFADF